MKLSIERAALLKAVAQAQSVVERRNTIPILANVLIEAEGSDVSFRATDLDIEVVDKAPAMVERAGATTVSATTLHEIVRKLPDGAQVTLSADPTSGRLTVEAGRSNFSLATLPKEDFPVMASSEYTTNFSAPAPVLMVLAAEVPPMVSSAAPVITFSKPRNSSAGYWAGTPVSRSRV